MLFVIALAAAILWIPSPWGWVLVGAAAIVDISQTMFWFWWSGKRKRAKVGAETLIGKTAIVALPCRPEGQVRVDGELWTARCEEGADAGETVTVEAIDGLTLTVVPR